MPLFRRDPTKKLQQRYERTMEAAMQAMRKGDIRENSRLVAEGDRLRAEIDALKTSSS